MRWRHQSWAWIPRRTGEEPAHSCYFGICKDVYMQSEIKTYLEELATLTMQGCLLGTEESFCSESFPCSVNPNVQALGAASLLTAFSEK
jgi:hypothetical protein